MAGGIGRFASRGKTKSSSNAGGGDDKQIASTTNKNNQDSNDQTLNLNLSNSNQSNENNQMNNHNENEEISMMMFSGTPFDTSITDDINDDGSRPPTSGTNVFQSFNEMTMMDFENEFGNDIVMDNDHDVAVDNVVVTAAATATAATEIHDTNENNGGNNGKVLNDCRSSGNLTNTNTSTTEVAFDGMMNFDSFHDLESSFYQNDTTPTQQEHQQVHQQLQKDEKQQRVVLQEEVNEREQKEVQGLVVEAETTPIIDANTNSHTTATTSTNEERPNTTVEKGMKTISKSTQESNNSSSGGSHSNKSTSSVDEKDDDDNDVIDKGVVEPSITEKEEDQTNHCLIDESNSKRNRTSIEKKISDSASTLIFSNSVGQQSNKDENVSNDSEENVLRVANHNEMDELLSVEKNSLDDASVELTSVTCREKQAYSGASAEEEKVKTDDKNDMSMIINQRCIRTTSKTQQLPIKTSKNDTFSSIIARFRKKSVVHPKSKHTNISMNYENEKNGSTEKNTSTGGENSTDEMISSAIHTSTNVYTSSLETTNEGKDYPMQVRNNSVTMQSEETEKVQNEDKDFITRREEAGIVHGKNVEHDFQESVSNVVYTNVSDENKEKSDPILLESTGEDMVVTQNHVVNEAPRSSHESTTLGSEEDSTKQDSNDRSLLIQEKVPAPVERDAKSYALLQFQTKPTKDSVIQDKNSFSSHGSIVVDTEQPAVEKVVLTNTTNKSEDRRTFNVLSTLQKISENRDYSKKNGENSQDDNISNQNSPKGVLLTNGKTSTLSQKSLNYEGKLLQGGIIQQKKVSVDNEHWNKETSTPSNTTEADMNLRKFASNSEVSFRDLTQGQQNLLSETRNPNPNPAPKKRCNPFTPVIPHPKKFQSGPPNETHALNFGNGNNLDPSVEASNAPLEPVTPSPSILKKKQTEKSSSTLSCKHLTPPSKSTKSTPRLQQRNDQLLSSKPEHCGKESYFHVEERQDMSVVTPFQSSNKNVKITPSPEEKSRVSSLKLYPQEDMNFDDLLTKFQKDLVDSTDTRKQCDNQLVDLRVQMCVSENVTLRLHACFDDLLEEIEFAMTGH